ncbi:hypothetical protein TNCV_2227841 [Trichonephila clavipes]|nr:hypothetical protein TNCV_2227841 [Trichonephila clavipes]
MLPNSADKFREVIVGNIGGCREDEERNGRIGQRMPGYTYTSRTPQWSKMHYCPTARTPQSYCREYRLLYTRSCGSYTMVHQHIFRSAYPRRWIERCRPVSLG